MPDEILAIIIISIAAGTAITILKTLLAHRERTQFGLKDRASEETRVRSTSRSKDSSSGASMTSSELEAMVKRAAVSAVAPLREDLASMEDRLDEIEERSGKGRIDLGEHLEGAGGSDDVRTKTVGTREQ